MIKEGPTCCSSATISAVSVVWDHICPDDDDLDDEGITEFFDFLEDIYKWTTTEKGLKDYLKVRFEEEEESIVGKKSGRKLKETKVLIEKLKKKKI